jgi:hypothetical protein
MHFWQMQLALSFEAFSSGSGGNFKFMHQHDSGISPFSIAQ